MRKTVSVVIPSSWQENNLQRIMLCLQAQTIKPEEIFVIIDKILSWDEKKKLLNNLSSKLHSSFFKSVSFIFSWDSLPFWWKFTAGKGVSFVRNTGIKLCKSEFIQCFDDDVFIDPDFFAVQRQQREKIQKNQNGNFLLIPTVYYRNTKIIQTLGIQKFIYRLARPLPITKNFYSGVLWFFKKTIGKLFSLPKWNYKPQMIASISLFWPAKIFQATLYDENLKFVMEDYDFSYRCFLSEVDLIVSKEIQIYHFERDKTIAEHSFVSTPNLAFQKAQNMILFVRKNATLYQKWQFFLIWLPIWIVYFSLFICFQTTSPFNVLMSFFKWLKNGFTLSLSSSKILWE